MRPHNIIYHRQPDACTFDVGPAGGRSTKELPEKLLLFRLRNTKALVTNPNRREISFPDHIELDCRLARRILDRIIEKIPQGLSQSFGIGMHFRKAGINANLPRFTGSKW